MRRFSVTVLVCALLAGFSLSCQKMTSETSGPEATVAFTELPASYGSLEANSFSENLRFQIEGSGLLTDSGSG